MILSRKCCVNSKVNLVFPISTALGNAGPLLPVSIRVLEGTAIPFNSVQNHMLRVLAHLKSLSPPGGKLQKPQSESGSVPGQHEAAPHDRGLQVEHETDRPLGPGGSVHAND